MTGGGSDPPPMPMADNGGEFLLSLLQRPSRQPQTPPQQQSQLPPSTSPFTLPPRQQQQQPPLILDPAVAAVGPSVSFASPLRHSNGRDLLSPPWPHNLYPRLAPGFPQPPSPAQVNQLPTVDDLQRLGISSTDMRANKTNHHLVQQRQQLAQKLQFGSLPSDILTVDSSLNVNSNFNGAKEWESRNFNALERNEQFYPQANSNSKNFDLHGRDRIGIRGKQQQHGGHYRSPDTRPPPGFSTMPRGGRNWDYVSRRRELESNMNKQKGNHNEFDGRRVSLSSENSSLGLGLSEQLDRPGPPAGSNLHSVSPSKIEASLMKKNENVQIVEAGEDDDHQFNDAGEELVESLLVEGESVGNKDKMKNRNFRGKESRSDTRGQRMLSQRMRMIKRQMQCRRDIDRMNVPFLAIYESLIPPEEEKAKQSQLKTLLEKLVNKEWPKARLHLYGSCANSFGVSKSDIDVCIETDDEDVNKSEVLLKLADILQSDNLQNVQALTRARVPIVKLMDPVTGISCDVCINNMLAVVNTKLLRDYAQIDVRLRQLAFIVKHWAKSRGVNETYQGTLSSYAYVLMCIHFLQQRRPAILPCLQGMKTTYSDTVDGIECAFFDKIEELRGFGTRNKETIAQLVWAFFNYWAYRHDYANDVISVRTGRIISKQEKDWTRRIGNDRHLICIEDPFEISHDLGRVVDKGSIKVLREEFERAAHIMQNNQNPCVTLFEPYVPT